MMVLWGDYGEQTPWQYPDGRAVQPIFDAMGVLTFWVLELSDLQKAATAACNAVHMGGRAAVDSFGQKFLGAKAF